MKNVLNFVIRISVLFVIWNLWFVILATLWFVVLGPEDANAATISKPMQNLGLVGYWSFDVGKGTAKAVDMSGRGNHGTLTNMNTAAAWVGGKIGNALDFDGSNDSVDRSADTYTKVGGDLSLSFWLNSTTGLERAIIQYGRTGLVAGHWGATVSNNTVYFYDSPDGGTALGQGHGVTFSFDLTDGTWHNVVITRTTAGLITIYADGANGLTTTGQSGQLDDAQSSKVLSLGSHNDAGNVFFGKLDEVRIYNRALSADEIKRLYRQTSPQMNASQANKLRQGLVGMWTFDGVDMGTTSAIDRSGNGNTGWLINGPKKVVGKLGQALNFDGVNDYVAAPGSFPFPGNSQTVSVWAKFNAFGAGENSALVSRDNDAVDWGLILELNGSSPRWQAANTVPVAFVLNGNNVLSLSTWYHIVGTIDGSNLRLYVNGVQDTASPVAFSGTIRGPGSQYTIGALGLTGGRYTNGLIDEVRIYNRALTPAEIKQLYKAGSSFHPNVTNKSSIRDGLVGHWSFDGNDMGTTSARDASGAGNTGWLINGTKKVIGKIGQGLNFDGVNDYVNVGDVGTFDTTFANFSVSAWIKPNPGFAGEKFLTGKMGAVGQRGWQFGIQSNYTLHVDYFNSVSGTEDEAISAGAVVADTWTHVAFTFTGSNSVKIYINGSLDTTDTTGILAQLNGSNTTSLQIGNRGDNIAGQYFPGLIDEVRVYNRALTPAEIKRLYNMGR